MAKIIQFRTVTNLSSALRRHLWAPYLGKNVVFQSRRYRCGVFPGNAFVNVSEEVREAIETQKPVVALETTIYTHGG